MWSGLPPEADLGGSTSDVAKVPQADMPLRQQRWCAQWQPWSTSSEVKRCESLLIGEVSWRLSDKVCLERVAKHDEATDRHHPQPADPHTLHPLSRGEVGDGRSAREPNNS